MGNTDQCTTTYRCKYQHHQALLSATLANVVDQSYQTTFSVKQSEQIGSKPSTPKNISPQHIADEAPATRQKGDCLNSPFGETTSESSRLPGVYHLTLDRPNTKANNDNSNIIIRAGKSPKIT